MKTKLTVLISCLMVSISWAQTIEKFSIDSGGASATSGDISILYTIGEVNVQELSAGTVAVSEGFINGSSRIKVNPKTFLQGPMFSPSVAGQMNDNLRANALIPTTSPYADAATCNASVFNVSGPNAIVDWVWVELRAANNNQKLINGRSAWIQRDGHVVSVDGTTALRMYAAPTNYYVVVKHRNHLGAMTATTFGLKDSSTTLVDFTANGMPTYGNNARTTLSTGKKALWAGDADNNGIVQYASGTPDPSFILSTVLNSPLNFLNLPSFPLNGYANTDIDMNGQTQYLGAAADSPFILQTVLANPANFLNLTTFPLEEQLPTLLGRAMENRTAFETNRKNNN